MTVSGSRIAFIGDVHLDVGDPELPAFSTMLHAVSRGCDTIVLMGDLFNLWIGQDELQQSHQHDVANTLREIRSRGVRTCYVEGNRDYHIATALGGDLFDAVAYDGIEFEVAGRRLFAIHGDRANPADYRNNVFRWISRSKLCWWCFSRLSPRRRLQLSARLENQIRHMNLAFKAGLPRKPVDRYATRLARSGYEAILLGHFHVEKRWTLAGGGEVYVLPEWKGSRRHLEADASGIRFVDSPG